MAGQKGLLTVSEAYFSTRPRLKRKVVVDLSQKPFSGAIRNDITINHSSISTSYLHAHMQTKRYEVLENVL
jgi:hypothetical protein